MQDEDLMITREDEEKALREAVRLGYMKQDADGRVVMTEAGMRRVEGMMWAYSQGGEARAKSAVVLGS